MNPKTKHLILAVFSLILVFGSVLIQSESKNKEDLKNIKFGRPFAFISQDHSDYYSFQFFPTWDRFDFKKIGTAKNFNIVNFLASLASIFIALEILIYLLETTDFWLRKKLFKK